MPRVWGGQELLLDALMQFRVIEALAMAAHPAACLGSR